MIRKHHDMITSVLETFKVAEGFVPFGDHSSLEKSWYMETNSIFYKTFEEFEPKKNQ